MLKMITFKANKSCCFQNCLFHFLMTHWKERKKATSFCQKFQFQLLAWHKSQNHKNPIEIRRTVLQNRICNLLLYKYYLPTTALGDILISHLTILINVVVFLLRSVDWASHADASIPFSRNLSPNHIADRFVIFFYFAFDLFSSFHTDIPTHNEQVDVHTNTQWVHQGTNMCTVEMDQPYFKLAPRDHQHMNVNHVTA